MVVQHLICEGTQIINGLFGKKRHNKIFKALVAPLEDILNAVIVGIGMGID